LKLGSLFDGIAGFPYVASKFGIEAVWASEIIEPRIRITKKHFPNMKHLGDITKINGAEIEPVDVITMGSPCQDLSVAGKRAGLEGERSGLFMQGIRIIREMRDATNGKYPSIILWENVPGAFSSNKGEDFRAVLEEIGESKIPMPRSGRWATAGMVRTKTADIAWRVLDAQYWGVPQRRKRIFLVADFRGQRAGEILFEPESSNWHSAESRKAREEAAATAGNGVETTGYALTGYAKYIPGCGTLRSSGGDQGGGSETLIAQYLTRRIGCRYDPETETLIPVTMREVSRTLRSNAGAPKAVAFDCRNLVEQEVSTPLQSKLNGGYSLNFQNPVRVGYAVRRLTPLEAERLQGYPDGWTEGESDTQRYAAIGDSVAIPCVEWIMKRIWEVTDGS